MTKADPQSGNYAAYILQDFGADTEISCFFRSAGTWRDYYSVRFKLLNLLQIYLVVSVDDDFCSDFSDVLDKVVDEGIVVVDHQNSQAVSPPAFLSALIRASALWSVSNHSFSGTESATMPAPA